jgi:hypothetical protein
MQWKITGLLQVQQWVARTAVTEDRFRQFAFETWVSQLLGAGWDGKNQQKKRCARMRNVVTRERGTGCLFSLS